MSLLDVVCSAGVDHYIHHAKFNYNYGANPLWDILMGTQFPEDTLERFLQSGGGRGSAESVAKARWAEDAEALGGRGAEAGGARGRQV